MTEAVPIQRLWRKGHPRDASQASACRWLDVAPVINPQESMRPALKGPSRILGPADLPDGKPQLVTVTLYPMTPTLGLLCRSVELLERVRATIPEPVRPTTTALAVSLDVCRLCPWWEVESKQ